MKTRVQAKIVGRVQGVGFRPTVYRYATQLGLAGFVRNDPHGITLEVEGEEQAVAAFFEQLQLDPPRQAVITDIEKHVLDAKGYEHFGVVESRPVGTAEVHISPDLATCDDCMRELFDPQDRRHNYPFINCTNCGPRFTIIRDLPYDRDKTSMAGFAICAPCNREYHDPRDRRFHAQPDACEDCGPELVILTPQSRDQGDNAKTERFSLNAPAPHPDPLPASGERGKPPAEDAHQMVRPHEHMKRDPFSPTEGEKVRMRGSGDCIVPAREALQHAVDLLRHGAIVAIKSLGGYHLACDATNAEAVTRLRQRKHRPHKPLAVMFRDIGTLKRHCEVSEAEGAELVSVSRPIVVLTSNSPALQRSVTPDCLTIGAFLPYTPLHYLLMQGFDALVMTSGNLADEPIVSDEAELSTLLGPIADAALSHNRPIVHKCDDSVLRVVNGQRQFFRRARGFVPNPVRFAAESPHILAVGGELKNTFCLARDGFAFLSQHIGDLKEHRTHEYFEHEITEWQRLMRIEPEVVAYDLHPSYLSTKFALKHCGGDILVATGRPDTRVGASTGIKKIGVQHHHAHIASVMAEHNLHEPVIGVALDGTGYGTDGTIWGGEFLAATRADFERVAHFKQYPLPGGEKAILEPWRMAASVLIAEGLCEATPKLRPIQKMIEANFNSPLTSSAGRLFDAVAAILGLCDVATYEAQAAIRLEAVADARVRESYPFEIGTQCPSRVLDFGGTIRAILDDKRCGKDVGVIATKFHNSVAAAIVEVCQLVRDERGLKTVALSGGVFQNELLLRRTVETLQAREFKVFTNALAPPNDGGLALGQAVVAAERIRIGEGANGRNGESETAGRGRNAAPTIAATGKIAPLTADHQSPITNHLEHKVCV